MRYLLNAAGVFPLLALISALLYVPVAFFLHRRTRPQLIRHIANYLLLGYTVSLLWAVFLWAMPKAELADAPLRARLNLTLGAEWLRAYREDGGAWSSQVMWNIFLFMPFGALLPCVFPALRRRAWETVVICLVLTVLIECVQAMLGRVADIDDVFCNTVGGIGGVCGYVVVSHWFRNVSWTSPVLELPKSRGATVVAYLGLLCILLVPTVFDLLLHAGLLG